MYTNTYNAILIIFIERCICVIKHVMCQGWMEDIYLHEIFFGHHPGIPLFHLFMYVYKITNIYLQLQNCYILQYLQLIKIYLSCNFHGLKMNTFKSCTTDAPFIRCNIKTNSMSHFSILISNGWEFVS